MLTAAVGTEEVARRLTTLLAQSPHERVDVTPFTPGAAPPRRVIAIDGSNVAIAESGAHLLGALRVGRVDLLDGAAVARAQEAPEVMLLTDGDDAPLRERLAESGCAGAQLPRLGADALLRQLRALAEQRAALAALDDLDGGDLLLLDGAVQARPTLPLMDRIVAAAREKGVDVVGVCKSTSMTVGAVPAFVACRLAARACPSPTWFAELTPPPSVRARVLVARLSAAEPRPFRLDVAAHDGNAPRVLPALASLAGHPAYPGYPSPLAMAHNAALLSEQDRLRLRALVHDAVVDAGVREDDWAAAFVDYHDILELGA